MENEKVIKLLNDKLGIYRRQLTHLNVDVKDYNEKLTLTNNDINETCQIISELLTSIEILEKQG